MLELRKMLHTIESSHRLAWKVAGMLGEDPEACDPDELANLALVIATSGALETLRFYRTMEPVTSHRLEAF